MADEADALTLDRFGALDLRVETKPDLTPVTDADKSAEELLRGAARRRTGPTTRCSAKSSAAQRFSRAGSGCSIRSTAPRTSSAACRCGRRSSRCCRTAFRRSAWSAHPRWRGGGGPARARARSRRSTASTPPHLGVGRRRPRLGQPVVLRPDHRLGRAPVAVPRPHRRRVAGARLRRLLVVLPAGRGRGRHRRRARGQAVGPGAARHPGPRGRRPVHQHRRRAWPARRQRGRDQRTAARRGAGQARCR